jgi:hypothetical protein
MVAGSYETKEVMEQNIQQMLTIQHYKQTRMYFQNISGLGPTFFTKFVPNNFLHLDTRTTLTYDSQPIRYLQHPKAGHSPLDTYAILQLCTVH